MTRDRSPGRWLLPAITDRAVTRTIDPVDHRGRARRARRPAPGRSAGSVAGRIVTLCLLLACLVSPALSQQGAAPDRGARAYHLRGDLTASLALDLQAALRAGFRRIVVTSRGGEVLVARAMADLLNRANAILVAEGQCHSACTYLWLATKRHELGRDADLALHATFDEAGPNDFGQWWLRELGRPDLAAWARSTELHHLTPDELLGKPGHL